MKFNQLTIGLHFRYEDKTYTKTGPLQAQADDSNKPRMIMRAATIQSLDNTVSPKKEPESFDPDALRAALEQYHRQCLSILETAGSGPLAPEARQQLDTLYARMQQIAS